MRRRPGCTRTEPRPAGSVGKHQPGTTLAGLIFHPPGIDEQAAPSLPARYCEAVFAEPRFPARVPARRGIPRTRVVRHGAPKTSLSRPSTVFPDRSSNSNRIGRLPGRLHVKRAIPGDRRLPQDDRRTAVVQGPHSHRADGTFRDSRARAVHIQGQQVGAGPVAQSGRKALGSRVRPHQYGLERLGGDNRRLLRHATGTIRRTSWRRTAARRANRPKRSRQPARQSLLSGCATSTCTARADVNRARRPPLSKTMSPDVSCRAPCRSGPWSHR